MKFFITFKNYKFFRVKTTLYDAALLNPELFYTSFFICIRIGVLRRKNMMQKQKEMILKDILYWQKLAELRRIWKITFYNLNKHLSQKRLKNLSLLDRFVNLFFKDGLKIKYLNYFNKSIQNVYYTLYFFWKTLTFSQYIYIDSLFSSEKHNYDIFSAILDEMTLILEPMFQLRVEKVNKQFKKIIKKRFNGKIVYIKPHKRLHLALKSLILYLNLFKPYKIHERLYYSFFRTLVEQKQGFLYKKKIHLYDRLVKKSRVRKILE